jgi:hypothetical protein
VTSAIPPRLARIQRVRRTNRSQDPIHADLDGVIVESIGLTCLVEENLLATLCRGLPERSVGEPGVDGEWCAKRPGQLGRVRIVEIGSHLGEVGPVVGGGVKIDSHRTFVDDLAHEEVSEPGGR